MGLLLRNARAWQDGELLLSDVAVDGQRVTAIGPPDTLPRAEREVDLGGRILFPGLVNGHDHLDFSTFPPLGRPPYPNVYAWASDVDGGAGDPAVQAALAVPLPDRLFLGGIRNLLAGVTAVAHHNPYHRSLGRRGFPVRVLAKYGFAHSPGLTRNLRRTYRTTDRRIPWMVHAAEGTDARSRSELLALMEANVLRQNTVIIHGIALPPEEGARGTLSAPGAAFVTLTKNGRLRGCIGYTEAVAPLFKVVQECAVAAATEDPRFPPVSSNELPSLRIEISVLTPLVPILPEEVEVGRHGLMVSQGGMRGLLLPQVPVEWGWDRETFLDQTCVKAGLPPSAWRHGATLRSFTAEVFGEEEKQAT